MQHNIDHTSSRNVCKLTMKKYCSLFKHPLNSSTFLLLLNSEVKSLQRVWMHCSSMTNSRMMKTTPCTEKATRNRPTPGSDIEKQFRWYVMSTNRESPGYLCTSQVNFCTRGTNKITFENKNQAINLLGSTYYIACRLIQS